MPRMIDADALVERLKKSHEYHARTSREEVLLARDIRIIKEQPTIDAEPVRHGTWKLLPNGDGICDQCNVILKNVWDEDGWLHFCSCCGAKMDGGEACGTAQTQPNGKGCEMRITAAEAGKDEQTRI